MQLIATAATGRYISSSNNEYLGAGFPVATFDNYWFSGKSPLGKIMMRYAPQVFGLPRPQGPVSDPNSFPPMLYPLTRPPRNPHYKKLVLGWLGLQAAIIVALPLIWNSDALWNPNLQRRVYTNLFGVQELAFVSNDRLMLVSGSLNGGVGFLHLPGDTIEPVHTGLPNAQVSALSPDKQLIAIGDEQHAVTIWKVGDASLVRTFATTAPQQIASEASSLAIAPDNDTVAVGSNNGTLRLWSIRNGKQRQALVDNGDIAIQQPGYSAYRSEIKMLAFTQDGASFISVDGSNTVRLWQLSRGTFTTIVEDADLIDSVAITPDGGVLAIGTYDGLTILYQLPSGQQTRTLSGNGAPGRALAFSPDGKRLAIGDDKGTIRIWRTADGALLQTMSGHSDDVTALAFSADGRTLASSAFDKTICLWDVSQL